MKVALLSKINFEHPKWPSAAILKKKRKLRFDFEMVRNENGFRTSKMAAKIKVLF
jgi:hypothetical protein